MSLRLAFRYALYHIGSIVIFTTSLISHTSGLEPPPPPPGYVTGGLFMWYWQNLTSVGACPEGEAITGFSPLSGSYARPLCSEIYALKGVATAFGSGMTGSLNRLLKYTPDGEHVGNSSLFESGGRVGIGTDSPGAFLDSIGDILVNGVLIGRGGGGIISNLVVGGGGALFANISGGRNTVFGNNSLRSNTSGNGNTTHGYSALSENTFGNNNVGIGNQAGIGLTSGDNNIFLGYNTPPNIGPTASNQLNIGNWIFGYNGNIGIGVTNPQYRLDVGGDVNFASGVCIDGVCKDNWEDIGPWKNFGTSIAYTGGSVAIGGDFVSAPQYRVDVTGGYVNSSSGYCIGGDCRKTWNDVGYWTKNGTGIIYTGSAEVGDDFFVYGSGYIRDGLSLSGMLRVTGETYTDENIHSEKYVNGKIGLCMNYDCRTSWGTAGQWTNIGPTTIYYSGNVNIGNNFNAGGTGIVGGNFFVGGTTNIGGNTYVSGNISSSGYILSQSGFCLGGNCVNNWNQIVSNTLSGTQNYLAKFTPDGSHIGDSIVYESGGRVGIGTNTPRSTLELSGALSFGDFGSWYSGVVNRNWLGICKGCAGIPADSTTGNSVFHVSGVSNDSFGTTLSGQTTRVIGLFDTTLIGTSLGIGRGTLPREALDVNGSAVISDIFIGKGGGSILSNTAIGSGSLSQNGIGYQNTALGFHSLHSNTSGYQNTALGEGTLEANISGNVNTALGSHALYQNTIGNSNSAVGVNSLGINTIGSNNTAMGMYSLIQSTGNNNTALGYSVGSNLTAGNNNIFIGANVQPNISNIGSNQLNLGNWIYGNNGDIGIAIPTPGYRLDVAGGFANTSSGYCIAGDCRTSWASIAGGNINGTLNSLAKFTPTGQSIGNSQVFDDGTNVGIGTTTPSQRLDVNGSIHIASGITDTAGLRMDQNGGWFRTYGPTGWYNQTYGGGWHMNDTTWIRAYNNKSVWTDQTLGAQAGLTVGYGGTSAPALGAIINGYLGVGTSTPQERLDVNGSLILDTGFPEGGRLIWRGGLGGNQEYRARVAGSGELGFFPIETGNPGAIGPVLTMTPTGHVFVGNYASGYTTQDKLYVMGNVTATAYLYSSDARLKHDIRPLEHALDKVLALTGRTFTWNAGNKKDIGLIAQEVETVFPELVHTSSGMLGYKSIEYGNLVAPLIESVKELYTLFTGQKEELQRLRDENMKQEEKIHELESRLSEIEKRLQ